MKVPINNTKLAKLIGTFTEDEFKMLGQFLKRNSSKAVVKLYNLLKEKFPDISSISKQDIYRKIYGNKSYSDRTLKNLFTEAFKTCEKFLIDSYLNSNSWELNSIRLKIYQQRKLESIYLSLINALESEKDIKFSRENTFDKDNLILGSKIHYYIHKNDFRSAVNEKIIRTEYSIVGFVVKYLERLRENIIIEKGYNLNSRNEIFEAFKDNFNTEKFLNSIESKAPHHYELIRIYYLNYLCLNNPGNIPLFYELRDLILENISKFSRAERYFLFSDLTSCCTEMRKLGYMEFWNVANDLYKLMFETDSYTMNEDDYLSVVLYRSVMLAGISLKDTDSLRAFGEKYTKKLNPDFRQGIKNLLDANIAFLEKRYAESLEFLSKINYDFFMYKLDVKTLLLKIFYELKMFEQAYSTIDSFSHYLGYTNEINEDVKAEHRNFLMIYKKLLNSLINNDLFLKAQVMSELKSGITVSNLNWLTEKASVNN